MIDEPTRKELRKVIENATKKMAKVADSIENNPSNLFEALADFGVSFDELRFKAEEVSKRLSKPPSIEQMLKGT